MAKDKTTQLEQYNITIPNLKLIDLIIQLTKQDKNKIINDIIDKYSLHYLEQESKSIIEQRHYPISIIKSTYHSLFRVRLDN